MKNLKHHIMLALVGSVSLWQHQAQANSDVQKVVDSYLVAKAENVAMTDDEVRKAPYTIQVASYINEKDAASHVEELRIQERAVRYYPAFIRGQVWYKVCVGQFETKEAAETYKKTFIQRVDEPFSVVISMLDRPGSESKVVAQTEAKPVVVTKPEPDVTSKVETAQVETPKVETLSASGADREPSSVKMFYSLQIGAFESEKIAYEHLVGLPVKNQYTSIESAEVKGKKWYRVLVGRFDTKSQAEDYQKDLSEKAKGIESFVRKVTKN